LLHRGGQARLHVEKNFAFENVNVKVGLDFALGRNQRGITAIAGPKVLDVVGDLPVKKTDPVGANDAKPASIAQVDDAGGLLQCGRVHIPFYDGQTGIDELELLEEAADFVR